MTSTVSIGSSSQWSSLLSSSTVVIADFYADWCGPCKVIAPTFESLSTKYSKPGKITFAKVNVDTQQEVARRHGVSAMPTFMVFKSGSVVETVRGANPPALTAAVEKGVRLATGAGGGAGPSGSSFGSPGQRLGSDPKVPARGPRRAPAWDFAGIIKAIFIFLGLYFVSLFSLDPYKAAEGSRFNVFNPAPKTAPLRMATSGGGSAAPKQQQPPRATVRTLADLGSE